MQPDTSHPAGDGNSKYLDEIIGKGPADPDMQEFYPGEEPIKKAAVKNKDGSETSQ